MNPATTNEMANAAHAKGIRLMCHSQATDVGMIPRLTVSFCRMALVWGFAVDLSLRFVLPGLMNFLDDA